MQQETFLYRFFDADDALLYVGISTSALRRYEEHQRDKPWASQIRRSSITPFATRADALEAERIAIQSERPRFNIVHNNPRRSCSKRVTALIPVHAFAAVGLANRQCPLGVVLSTDAGGLVLGQVGGLSHGYGHDGADVRLPVRWLDVLDLAWTMPKFDHDAMVGAPPHWVRRCGQYERHEDLVYCGRGVGGFQFAWQCAGFDYGGPQTEKSHPSCDDVNDLLRPDVLFFA